MQNEFHWWDFDKEQYARKSWTHFIGAGRLQNFSGYYVLESSGSSCNFQIQN